VALLLDRDGVRLTGVDFGGHGRPVLLLHGLHLDRPAEWRSALTEFLG
jgi:hypothetical protein